MLFFLFYFKNADLTVGEKFRTFVEESRSGTISAAGGNSRSMPLCGYC